MDNLAIRVTCGVVQYYIQCSIYNRRLEMAPAYDHKVLSTRHYFPYYLTNFAYLGLG